jgi:hypothetical protein
MKTSLLTALMIFAVSSVPMKAQTIPSYVPPNGLKGWWPFNGNANDESGNGHNGTVSGASLTADRMANNNNAYSMGSGHIFCAGSGMPTNGLMTIAFWFNESSDYGIGEIISLGESRNSTWGAVGGNNAFTLNYGRSCGSTGSSLQAIAAQYNQWHHVVYVSAGFGSQCDVYYDGTFVGTSTTASSSGSCGFSTLYLGKDPYMNTFFPGKLDDIGIWNRALTACEISNLFAGSVTSCNVGINERSKESVCSVFPNPAANQTVLNVDKSLIGEAYSLYDYRGKLISSETISRETTPIELTGLAAGIYFLSVGTVQRQVLKIVKN